MREFVFALEYDPGANPVADVLEANGQTEIASIACHVSPESLWRMDRATGPTEALDALEAAYADSEYYADCLVRDDCGADVRTEVLSRGRNDIVVYSYWNRTDECTSVPHLALDILGDGLVFETHRSNRRYRWRLLLDNDGPIHPFFAALEAEAGACAGIDVIRISELDPRDRSAFDDASVAMAPEQRSALKTAVENGYYESPRACDLSELAAILDIPSSTFSYRLRRAEAALARAFFEDRSESEFGISGTIES